MISVKFTKNQGLVGPCAGLHKITAIYATTSERWCEGLRSIIVDVYVDSSYSTIEAAVAAGATIYDETDCTTCATFGWYGDPGGNKCWYFGNFEGDCVWGLIPENCDDGNSITVRGSSSSTNLCNGVGVLYNNVYIDDTWENATGMWADAAMTQTATDGNGQTLNQNYYAEEGLGPIIPRYWSPFSMNAGGYFSGTVVCDNGGDNGGGPVATRYRVFLKYDCCSVNSICENGSSVTAWADNQDFEQATTLYTTETGTTKANDGYYVIDSTRAVVQPGDTNSYKVRRLRFGSLIDTTTNCNTGGDFRDDFDGEMAP
jgi:hypothetical protein